MFKVIMHPRVLFWWIILRILMFFWCASLWGISTLTSRLSIITRFVMRVRCYTCKVKPYVFVVIFVTLTIPICIQVECNEQFKK